MGLIKVNRLLSWTQYLKYFTRLKSESVKGREVGKLFFEPQVQNLLKKLSNVELEQAFPPRKTGKKLEPPDYKFLTDSELNEAIKEAENRAEQWMQMPPVLDAHVDRDMVLEKRSALDGHDADGAAFVFTDITFGVPEQERIIVVREPDGTLKHADWDQRQRVNEVYSPRPGRELVPPPMFQEEHLESLMERKEYKFILDRACIQYEPNDPEYVRITSNVYLRVSRENHFGLLRGTRHFGSLLFYLVFEKQIDTLLLDTLQNLRMDDAVSLVHLYHMIHPDSPSTSTTAGLEGEALLRAFISTESARRSVLELALQTCIERSQGHQKQQVRNV